MKSCRTGSPCSIRAISLQQSTNKLSQVVVHIFSDLSHAWVVSFVSIKVLVDLFSQSGVFFWSPWTQEMFSYKSANTPANKFHCTLLQGFHTCGNGLQGIPWEYHTVLQSALPDFPSFCLCPDLAWNCRRSTRRSGHPGRIPAKMGSIENLRTCSQQQCNYLLIIQSTIVKRYQSQWQYSLLTVNLPVTHTAGKQHWSLLKFLQPWQP